MSWHATGHEQHSNGTRWRGFRAQLSHPMLGVSWKNRTSSLSQVGHDSSLILTAGARSFTFHKTWMQHRHSLEMMSSNDDFWLFICFSLVSFFGSGHKLGIDPSVLCTI